MVGLVAYVVLTENIARFHTTAFYFVVLCAVFNAAVGSVYLCVADFHDVDIFPALEALGGLHNHVFGSSTNSRGSWASQEASWLSVLAA